MSAKRPVPAILAVVLALAPAAPAAPAAGPESAPQEVAAKGNGAGPTRIQGRAYEGRRRPVVGATVAVRDEDGRGVLALTSTDERGQMRVTDLPDGSYRVTFLKEGRRTVVKDRVEVRAPLRPVIEVPMARAEAGPGTGDDETTAATPGETADVAGAVTGPEGVPVADVRIRFVRADGAFDPRVARTGPDGRFRFEALPGGSWEAEVRGVGYLPIRAPVAVDRALEVGVRLVPQPTEYEAAAIDLLPDEAPVAPPGLETAPAAVEDSGPR